MRLFIDKHYFVSVIKQEKEYSCQVMELVHGMGMYNAKIDDFEQEDIISCIVTDKFERWAIIAKNMEEIFDFHKELLLQI